MKRFFLHLMYKKYVGIRIRNTIDQKKNKYVMRTYTLFSIGRAKRSLVLKTQMFLSTNKTHLKLSYNTLNIRTPTYSITVYA